MVETHNQSSATLDAPPAQHSQTAVVDLAPLFGFSGRGRRDDWRASSAAGDADQLARRLQRLAGDGHVVMSLLDQRLVTAWKRLRATSAPTPELVALLPNVRGMIREATDHGMIGAGVRRMLRVGPTGLLRLGFGHMFDALAVLRKDFPTLLAILVDLELGEARRLGAQTIVLHPQMTDLALAMENWAILRDFKRRVEGRGARAVLATNNAETLRAAMARDATLAADHIDMLTPATEQVALANDGADGARASAPFLTSLPMQLPVRCIVSPSGG